MGEKFFLSVSKSSKNTSTRIFSWIFFLNRFYFSLTCSLKYIYSSPPVILLYCYSKVCVFFFYLLLIYSACSWPWSLKGIFIHSELFLYFFQDSECNFQIEIPVEMRLPSSSPQCRKLILCTGANTNLRDTVLSEAASVVLQVSNCDLLSEMKNNPSSS